MVPLFDRKLMKKLPQPIIGIPDWWWKRPAQEYAKTHYNPVEIELTRDVCYECERHYDMLDRFDKGQGWEDSMYAAYQRKIGRNDSEIGVTITRFHLLYDSIRKDGLWPHNLPVITDNGVRINGSHRVAILLHLRHTVLRVNFVRLGKVFTPEQVDQINIQVEHMRTVKVSNGYRREHGCKLYAGDVLPGEGAK